MIAVRSALALLLLAAPAWAGEHFVDANNMVIVDGDTVRAGEERIRISNIDAAEMNGACDAERRLARLTRDRLAELLAGGEVEIERNGRDRYGRTLATVRVNGEDVGDRLVAEGYARVWRGRREDWCSPK